MSYSQIDSTEEAFVISGCLIYTIGFTLAAVFLIALRLQKEQIENKTVYNYANASLICTCVIYSFSVLFANDLIFPWEYGETGSFVSVINCLILIMAATNKVLFYFAFTYEVLSHLPDQSKSKKYLKIWMWIACVSTFILLTGCSIDIWRQESDKQIGYSANHNMFLTMYMGQEDAKFVPIFSVILMFVDTFYFILLMVLHVRKLRSDQADNKYDKNGAKMIVLLVVSCLFYWFTLVVVATQSSAKWWGPIDIIANDLCLFLLFKGQIALYESMCSKCDKVCLKCIYGKSQQDFEMSNTENDETNELI